ncbi:MAG: hypothetical protein KIS76_18280 [Pyrinomonadaceae bacterium]|nr:hypothetical protein [Pyrinomonadaceae bacterium]
MPKLTAFNESNFLKLLEWLDPDRDAAGEKYEAIRSRLITIFRARGCEFPDENADDTIDRVIGKIETIAENYQGNPALYFYGVAKLVYREKARKRVDAELPSVLVHEEKDQSVLERNDRCLEKCLQKLDSEQREFILEYYKYEKQDKIDHRRKMMEKLGISPELIRLRAFRVRNTLQKCVLNCLNGENDET